MTHIAGSCLCGEVAYKVDTRVKQFYFCHCQQCRKLTGSAHAANILAEPVEIDWLKGAENVLRYDAPKGRKFTHVFCAKCGSGLPFLNVNGSTLFIPAGSIDSDCGFEVTRNIFWGEAPEWYEKGLAAKRCTAFSS